MFLAVLMHLAGKFWLAYYGFKYNAGIGIGVILIDFVTFWFAFYKLEKEGKEKAATLWLLGTVLIAVMLGGFYPPIMDGLTGKAFAEDYLKPPAPTATATPEPEEEPEEEKKDEATNDAAATTGGATGATTTEGAAAGDGTTDGATAGGTAAGTAGGEAPADGTTPAGTTGAAPTDGNTAGGAPAAP
ncbi:MAG: hypothetical protein CMH57_14410 [Myxococcales bacterium]|nr:hypothetical protein [Myxococcales bacterium]